MERCTLRIELLSDLCVSDGSAYNSLIDTDICYDRYGFPYIPAKRIRGCLRECAIELNDWADPIDIGKLFGDKGDHNNGARLRIGNAYLEKYDHYRDFVKKNLGNIATHPQNVLSTFAYTRVQTSIDYEKGVADDASLRSLRVINRGLVFVADVEIDEAYICDLEKCCKVLRHMGVARTRGLGEVKATFTKKAIDTDTIEAQIYKHAPLENGAQELTYEIDLIESLICKSLNGGEANTQDYIEGSKMLGLIAGNLKEDYLDFMAKGSLKCYNAYIALNGKRCTEIPAYIYNIKNDKEHFINKLAETDEKRKETEDLQLNQTKHGYGILSNSELKMADVITEEKYHHRRSEDKSIGRAVANEDGDADFYQMDSISEGQQFVGKVTGSTEQIRQVYDILTKDRPFYLGYSRSSEYGKVRIRVLNTSAGKQGLSGRELRETTDVVATLNAPAIIYDDKASATTSADVLIDEILSVLGINDEPYKKYKFIRNTTVGGFNVTWNKRKPTIQTFDKGSAVRLCFEKPVKIPDDADISIGERTAEGYGELHVSAFDPAICTYEGHITKTSGETGRHIITVDSDFAKSLAMPIFNSYIRRRAIDAANDNNKDKPLFLKNDDIYRPTVSNMMIMLNESNNLTDIIYMVKERYGKKSETKENKRNAAFRIINALEDVENIGEEFASKYGIVGLEIDRETIKMKYLREYLIQIKYILRRNREKSADGGAGNEQ